MSRFDFVNKQSLLDSVLIFDTKLQSVSRANIDSEFSFYSESNSCVTHCNNALKSGNQITALVSTNNEPDIHLISFLRGHANVTIFQSFCGKEEEDKKEKSQSTKGKPSQKEKIATGESSRQNGSGNEGKLPRRELADMPIL